MNKYKKEYKVIERNVDLSEGQKLQAMENLLTKLNSHIPYVAEQYNYYQSKSKVPTIASVTAAISLIAATSTLLFALCASSADENVAYKGLNAFISSMSVFIPSYMLAGGEFHDAKPIPFTKESKFYHELKNIQKTINALQFEIDSKKKIEEAKQLTMM